MIIKTLAMTAVAALAGVSCDQVAEVDPTGVSEAITGDSKDDNNEVSADEARKAERQKEELAVESVQQLNLSNVFKLDFKTTGSSKGSTSLALTETGKKSAEVCEIERTVKDAFRQLKSFANTMCHIEVQNEIKADSFAMGVPTEIIFDMGGASLIDDHTAGTETLGDPEEGSSGPGDGNNDAGNDDRDDEEMGAMGLYIHEFEKEDGNKVLRVEMCQGATKGEMKLREFMEIAMKAEDKDMRKGIMITAGEESGEFGGKWADHILFKINPEKNTINLLANSSWKSSDGANGFSRTVNVDSHKKLTVMKYAESGSWVEQDWNNPGQTVNAEFAKRGMAAIGEVYGAAIFQDNYSNGVLALASAPVRRVFFNSDGNLAQEDQSPLFEEGGPLRLKPDLVPMYLKKDFKPNGFPEDAWDCSTTAAVTISAADMAKHDRCEDGGDYQEVNCWGDAFVESDMREEAPDVDLYHEEGEMGPGPQDNPDDYFYEQDKEADEQFKGDEAFIDPNQP